MKTCVVLGNGPSLRVERIPACDAIGVNRSYEVRWSPWWTTIDYGAFEALYENPSTHKPVFPIVRRDVIGRPKTPPLPNGLTIIEHFRGDSGQFGIHVAQKHGYERIYLLGFDPWTEDKFYGPGHPGARWANPERRKVLYKHRADPRLWRWDGAVYAPLADTIDWDEHGNALRPKTLEWDAEGNAVMGY